MKNRNYKTFTFLLILTLPILINAQEEKAPIPPPPPKYDFEFDFEGFPGIDEKEEKELLKALKKDLQDELKIIKEINKNKYFDFLRESQFKNLTIPFLAKRERLIYERDKKIFELEIKTEALASKFNNANKSDREKIKRNLKVQLEKLFTQKEELRKQEVEELQKELEELKKSLGVRLKNKNEIINRRLQELLNEDKYLDWD